MIKQDAMQVCLNGHRITSVYHAQPDQREEFCSECGAETIMKCQNCHSEIGGKDRTQTLVSAYPSDPPNHCNSCGTAYPWMDSGGNEIEEPNGLFHEDLASEALGHYHRGDYREAIQQAFIVLELQIKEESGLDDLVGANLSQEAFKQDSGPLRFGGDEGEEKGAMFLYAGAFLTYRNPSAHQLKENLTENQTYSILCLVNLLLKSIPEATEQHSN